MRLTDSRLNTLIVMTEKACKDNPTYETGQDLLLALKELRDCREKIAVMYDARLKQGDYHD